jgi:putative molybdopterin biosynthesis protein
MSAPLLRLARQARGLSQQQLAQMAGVTRQAVSAVESGHSDPSLRVALALARTLGMTVEELFGPAAPIAPVSAVPLAGDSVGERVMIAQVGDRFVALPLRGDTAARSGFLPASALADGPAGTTLSVRPLAPLRPTLVVAGCDPALPLLETPLSLLDPPVAFAWWPCGSGEALDLAARGLVHAAGVHTGESGPAGSGPAGSGPAGSGVAGAGAATPLPGAQVVGFSAWREGLVVRPELVQELRGLDDVARLRARIVNREPGSQARRVLDTECGRLGIAPDSLRGCDSLATGHLQVASAIAAGLADAGVASEPAALAYGLAFVPLTQERFDLVLPAPLLGSREVQSLLRVLTSPWLATQLASLPGYESPG